MTTAETRDAVKPQWTPEQERAITTRGSDLLVTAAAGAGKTAVLVERVIRLVLGGDGAKATPSSEPVGVDELLVVTFTEAAAAEMRDRLAQALRDRLAHLERGQETAPAPEAARLHLQLALLGRASISTLHSFCLSVLRRNFHRLGLDPSFGVLSEEEATLLREEVLDEVFEELYDRGDPGFAGLVEDYGSERGDEPLREVVLRLHAFSRSHPDPERWLDRAAGLFEVPPNARLVDLPFGRAVREDIALTLEIAAERLRLAETIALRPRGPAGYAPTLVEDVGRVLACARRVRAGSWGTVMEALGEAADFPDLPRTGKDEADLVLKKEARDTRDTAKRAIRNLADTFEGRSEEDLVQEVRDLAPAMRALASLVSRFDLAFRQAKDSRAALDFSDLEHLCLRALSGGGESSEGGAPTPSEAALEIQARYAEVLVDEYQDINGVQEQILGLVSRGDNLFMVGDMKQSIYRFRLADPLLFAAKYAAFIPVPAVPGKAHEVAAPLARGADPGFSRGRPKGRRVALPDNFRSRQPILDAVNFVFRQTMRADVAEIDYDQDSELRYGAGFYGPPGRTGPPVELHLLEGEVMSPGEEPLDADATPDDEDPAEQAGEPHIQTASGPSLEDLDTVERESCVIAERIKEMVDGPAPLQVYDKVTGGYRPVTYGDIAVLLRATTGLANQVLETLSKHGIPAYAQLSTGYFSATEVETVLSLLRVIDNPRQDIPLGAVLRSPVGGLDEGDLARVRLCARGVDFYDAVLAAAAVSGARASANAAAGAGAPDSGVDSGTRPTGGPATSIDPELGERLGLFLIRLESWRDAARRGPLSDLVWRLYRETGLYAYVGGLPGGARRQANLMGLHDRARLFDQFSRQGLPRFLRFIDQLQESGGDLGPPPAGEGEDAVRIMSVHRSKGLEFPVVFLAHLGKRMNFADSLGDLICHRTLGFGAIVTDAARRLKYPGLANLAVARRNRQETVAEEMRCLYVAMTRARDALVLVGTRSRLAGASIDWCLPEPRAGEGGRLSRARVARATSYLDWIVPALASHPQAGLLRELGGYGEEAVRPDGSVWELKVWGLPGFAPIPFEPPAPAAVKPSGPAGWERIMNLEPLPEVASGPLTAALEWAYPARRLTTLPAKVAPTELERLMGSGLEDDAVAAPPAGKSAPEHGPVPEAESLKAIRPAFLQAGSAGPTPTERGKATHLLLQHADRLLTRPAGPAGALDREGLTRLAADLVDREVMTPEQAASADTEAVARFFASELGSWLGARREAVKREVPFTLGLPAAEVYGRPGAVAAGAPGTIPEVAGAATDTATGAATDTATGAATDTVIVQGIIDALVVEPDGLTILDFKTDRVTAEEAAARAESYRAQVDLYRRAAETIWDRPVKAVYLYFLTPGVAVTVGSGASGA